MIRRPPRSPLFPYTPLSRSTPTVARLYTNEIASRLIESGVDVSMVILECAEQSKTLAEVERLCQECFRVGMEDRKSTRLNSSHLVISYAVFCLKKKTLDPPLPLEAVEDAVHRRALDAEEVGHLGGRRRAVPDEYQVRLRLLPGGPQPLQGRERL